MASNIELTSAEEHVGQRIREIRTKNGLSLRALAEKSGLNINTLSMVENGKTSPSVSTLQQLAVALNVPIAVFFEVEPVRKQIVFTRKDERPDANFGSARFQNLGQDLYQHTVQPFAVTLEPGAGSGDSMIVHTGHEFVYCQSGRIRYQVDGNEFILQADDSLLFEAHLPHCWENSGKQPAQILLVLFPSDRHEEPGGRHFLSETKKETPMKIAVITDDGKSISRHFGRAQYYMVLTIEDGKVTTRELRNKLGHNHFHNQPGEEEHTHGAGHGMDAASHDRHAGMAEAISDCKVLICGGMGMGAYESMRRLNIQPVVTDLEEIDEATQAFIDQKLVDHTEFLH